MYRHVRAPLLALSLALTACDAAPASPECTPGARPVCGCDDGRTGYQECLPDGTFGACVCAPSPASDAGTPNPIEDAGSVPEDASWLLIDSGSGPVDAGPPPGALWISRTAPASATVHTRDTVMLQYVAARPVDRVELLLDGALFAELAPPYTYSWDTRPYLEGEHTIVARAVRGEDTAEAETLTVVVDRTSPWIVSRFPAPNDPQTWLGEPFVIELSEPIVPSTVTDAAISVTDGGDIPLRKTLSVDASGTQISVRLSELPALPATLRLDVTSMATDLAGNPIVGDAWGLGVPVFARVRETLVPSTNPSSLALTTSDASGTPYVAWIETGVARVSRWDGAAWSELPALEPTPDATVSHLSMTADASGAPIIAWRSTSGGSDRIAVARWTGAAWAPLGGGWDVASSPAGPSVSLDGSGSVLLARTGTPTDVNVERWNGAAWEPIGNVVAAPAEIGAVAVAARATGEIVVAAGGATTSGFASFAQQWDGTSWVPLGGRLFDPYFGSHSVTRLALLATADSIGAFGAGSYIRSGAISSYSQMRWWSGTYWADTYSGPATPALALDDAGRVHALTASSTSITWWRARGSSWDTTGVVGGSWPHFALDLFHGASPAVAAGRSDQIVVYRSNEVDF